MRRILSLLCVLLTLMAGQPAIALAPAQQAALAQPTYIQPYDRLYIIAGDSRTAEGQYTTPYYGMTYTGAGGWAKGWQGNTADGFLGPLTDNRIRMGDFVNLGIGGAHIDDIVGFPRSNILPPSGTIAISGNILTVSGASGTSWQLGLTIAGATIASGTTVDGSAQNGATNCGGTCTGFGANGTYHVTVSQTVSAGTAVTTASWSSVKTLNEIASNPAAIVIFYMGTNNSSSGAALAQGGSLRQYYYWAIHALTDPSFVWPPSGAVLPLYQGRPKNIIIVNETPRGVDYTGTVASKLSTTSDAENFRQYAIWLKGFDYASRSGYENPRVIVGDVYNDRRILDYGTSSPCGSPNIYYCPKVGLSPEGLHLGAIYGWNIATVMAERVNKVIPPNSFALLPTSANVSGCTWLIPNPLFNITHTVTTATQGFGVGKLLFSDLIPPGTTFASGGTASINATFTMSNNATASGAHATIVSSAGLVISNATVTAGSNIITVNSPAPGGTITIGDGVGGAFIPDSVVITPPANTNTTISTNALPNGAGNELVLHVVSTSTPAAAVSFGVKQTASATCYGGVTFPTDVYRGVVRSKITVASGALYAFYPSAALTGPSGGTNLITLNGCCDTGPLGYTGGASTSYMWFNYPGTAYSLVDGTPGSRSDYMTTIMGDLDTRVATNSGAATNFVQSVVTKFATGTDIDATITISQMGTYKVTGDNTISALDRRDLRRGANDNTPEQLAA